MRTTRLLLVMAAMAAFGRDGWAQRIEITSPRRLQAIKDGNPLLSGSRGKGRGQAWKPSGTMRRRRAKEFARAMGRRMRRGR